MQDLERLERLAQDPHLDALILLKKLSRALVLDPQQLSVVLRVCSEADGTKFALSSKLFPEKETINFSCLMTLPYSLNEGARAFLQELQTWLTEEQIEFVWEEPSTVFVGWGESLSEELAPLDPVALAGFIWKHLSTGLRFSMLCTHVLKECSRGLKVNRGSIIWEGISPKALASFCFSSNVGREHHFND